MLASRCLASRNTIKTQHLFSNQCIRRFSNDRFAPRTSFNLKNGISLHIAQGDLTIFEGDAVINAANERMLGGGGVDGAIHRAAGPDLLEFIKNNIPIINGNIRCVTGDALITPGFNLNTQFIIHTVGPIYASYDKPELLLKSCYDTCLEIAQDKNLKSIAFPAISCGVYGYPPDEGIEIAFKSFEEIDQKSLEDIWFIVFGKSMFEESVNVANDLLD